MAHQVNTLITIIIIQMYCIRVKSETRKSNRQVYPKWQTGKKEEGEELFKAEFIYLYSVRFIYLKFVCVPFCLSHVFVSLLLLFSDCYCLQPMPLYWRTLNTECVRVSVCWSHMCISFSFFSV